MSIEKEPVREFKNTDIHEKKRAVLDRVINTSGYKNVTSFREQIAYIYDTASKLQDWRKEALPVTLTIRDIAHIFNISKSAVYEHIKKHKEDERRRKEGEEPRKNGRPLTLNKQEREKVKEWIESHETHPKYCTLQKFCAETFGKKLTYNSYVILLDKLGYKIIHAVPIEDKRYFVKQESLETFYNELTNYTTQNDIPSAFCFNLDEEGYEEYAIAKDELIIIEKSAAPTGEGSKRYYPVSRKGDHTTFLSAINAYGDFVKPLIVTKRATVEASLLYYNLGPDRIMLKRTEKGYITQEVFIEWFETCFIRKLQELRNLHKYSGPGMLLLDGAPQHFNASVFKMCEENNLYVVFLAPHSSNQTQPMDLGIFHVHKEKIRHTNLDSYDDSNFVSAIVQLYNAWQLTATTQNIIGAWKAMGATYEVLPGMCSIVRFNMDFAIKIMNQEKSLAEKKQIEEQRRSYGANKDILSKRIDLTEFNKMHELAATRTSPKINRLIDLHKSTQRPYVEAEPGSLKKLLSCMVSCDVAPKFPVVDNYTKWKAREKVEQNWVNLHFDSRLHFELESLGLW